MSYVPPHLRKPVKDDWIVQGKKKEKQNQIKEKVDEFPALVPILPVQKSKMDFKELFTRRKELKKRQKKMKYGWKFPRLYLTFDQVTIIRLAQY